MDEAMSAGPAGAPRPGRTLGEYRIPEELDRNGMGVVYKACHAANPGVIHRDVKPENILLRRPGDDAVLGDFGIVKMLGGRPPGDSQTGLGSVASSAGGGAADSGAPAGEGQADSAARTRGLGPGTPDYRRIPGRAPRPADRP